MNRKIMNRIYSLFLIVALAMSTFPASILAENSPTISGEYTLHISDATGDIIHQEALESFRFHVSGLDDEIYHYAFTEFEIRRDGQAFASANAPSLSPTIRLGDPSMYATGVNPEPVYAVYYRIHYVVLGESTEMATDWNQAQVNVGGSVVPFYFMPYQKPAITVVNVESLAPIQVPSGTAVENIGLPPVVNITLSDNSTQSVNVVWDNGDPTYDADIIGSYIFTGSLALPADVTNPLNLTANIEVTVVEIDLTDIEPPVWPADALLDVLDISSSSATLSWPAATDNVGVIGYRVWVDEQPYKAVTADVYEIQVTSLNPDTLYQFTVRAYDAASIESERLEASATTLPLAIVNVQAFADMAVSLGTEKIAIGLPNSAIAELSDGRTVATSVNWDEGTPTYDPYIAGEYVFSGSLIPQSPITNPTEIKASIKVVVEQDTIAPEWPSGSKLNSSNITASSVTLAWPVAIDNIAVTGYRVYMNGNVQANLNSNQHSYVVSNLATNTTYTFAVKALDAVGNESVELSMVVTTLAGTPEPPVQPPVQPPVPPVEPPATPTPSVPIAPPVTSEPPKPPVLEPGVVNPPSTERPVTFSDIAGHWAEYQLKQAIERNIVHGFLDGTVKPDSPTSRAEFVVMLVRALGLTGEGAKLNFTDNNKIGNWGQQAIAIAVKAGILNGFPDGSIRPNAQITRVEMAAMIARALKLSTDGAPTSQFADANEVPSWARGMVDALSSLGIIMGRDGNRFDSFATATRAEAAVMILRIIEMGEINK